MKPNAVFSIRAVDFSQPDLRWRMIRAYLVTRLLSKLAGLQAFIMAPIGSVFYMDKNIRAFLTRFKAVLGLLVVSFFKT